MAILIETCAKLIVGVNFQSLSNKSLVPQAVY